MKIRIIGIGSDGKEYTNDDTIEECEYPTIVSYSDIPSTEQINDDMGKALAILQFDLPQDVEFVKCKYVVIK